MAIAVVKADRRTTDAPFEALVLDFLAHLEFERGLARNTLEPTAPTCCSSASSGCPRRDATEAERADVADFLADLATGRADEATAVTPPARATDQPQDRLPALLLPPPAAARS